ncbi:hypothetical protein BGZ60DRAFT_469794 [Tricladium varicosporioides]|nr:hypothetical protein BGZ60DRAFT_469794 [Hymenoscyphus varicosporioides]
MAARPGEELVATLFADIHYYYGSPTSKPPHHRFDKGSYVYLFENAQQRRARVEIANSAGTPEQDAFTGYLDRTQVQYSYKHSTLLSLTVDSPNAQSNIPPDGQEWHLPTFDPRNENKYMYKLHTVDIYFWMKEDALQFVSGVRRVLPPQQITIQDEPVVSPPPHHHDTSPLVQKLENAAITDPTYQHKPNNSISAPSINSRASTGTFPGPPISATPQSQEASNFTPMAYNPAAPPAPETIKHREKTPPPPDAASNPLVAAANSDQGQFQAPTYGLPYQNPAGGFSGPPSQPQPQRQNSGQAYFPGPPATIPPPSQFAQPPPTTAGLQSPYAQHFQNSFAPPPTAPTTSSPYSQPPPQAAAPPPYQQGPQTTGTPQQHIPVTQQYAQYANPLSPGLSSPSMSSPGMFSPQTPGFNPNPSANPNAAFMPPPSAPPASANPNASFMPSPPPVPDQQPSPPFGGLQHSATAPPGGFAQYDYKQKPISSTQPLMNDYSIHSQVYRPTEEETIMRGKKAKEKEEKKKDQERRKLEQKADKIEKGLGSLFKRVEKKYG